MKRLFAPFCLGAALAASSASAAVISLTSVDWTATAEFEGRFTGTSTATGDITAETGAVPNAGTVVSPLNWGSLLNYSISVEEGAYAGAGAGSGTTTRFNFPNSVNQFYLLFKDIANTSVIDLDPSPDRTVTFLAGNNASFAPGTKRISATSTGTFDAIARVDKTTGNWGQDSSAFEFMAFSLLNHDSSGSTTGLFTLAVAGSPASPSSVPEQGGWTALAIIACTAAGIRLRHRMS